MSVPVISTSNPLANASDVFLNVPLYVTFASPGLTSSSITLNSVQLYNVATQSVVPIDVSYNTTTRVVTITQLSVLAENTVYSIRFPGTDAAISSSYVITESGSGDVLTDTLEVLFTTGTRIYIDDSRVDKDSADLSLEGDLRLPVNVKALGDLAVETSFPKNHTADVSGSINGYNQCYIKFNTALSGLTQDWASVNVYPMMDMDLYLASGTTFGTGTIPNMTGLSVSGQYLYINFDAEIPKNAAVQVKLSESITSTAGTQLGPNAYKLSFTTDRYPKISGPNYLRNELSAASDELNDEYIASLLLKNTIIVIQRWPAFNPGSPQYIAYKYVVNQTILDILDDKELEKALVAGTRRRLGDFDISIDYLVGQQALKYKRALEEAQDALDAIDAVKKLIARIDNAIYIPYTPDRLWHGVHPAICDIRFKYWQENIPMSNTLLNRQASNVPYQYPM